MPVRSVAATMLLLVLSACGGGSVASGPASTPGSGAGATASAAPSAAAGTAAAAIDLSGVDACSLVDQQTVEALTGETGFDTDQSSDPRSATCFWGLRGPQYLEVKIDRRTASLEGYAISPNGVACPGTTVPGVGVEAVGGVCSGEQTKVWLAAMDRGVMVQVIVNEPKSALTPGDLADAANGVIAGLE